jgi:hypothetical protein
MLLNSPEDSYRFGFDKEQMNLDESDGKWKKTGLIVKVFGWYSSPLTFLYNLGKNGAANWGYEYQTAGQPCKFAIDFDISEDVIGADALAKVEYFGHSAICQLEKELRAGLKRLLGMDQLEVYVWKGSRFKTDTKYKHSYHIVVANLHAAVIEDFAHLIKNIWPNGFLVGEGKDAIDAIDMKIFVGGRQFRAPGCAKLEADKTTEVPLGLLTRDPFGHDDELSPTVLSDPDFKATIRSLITVIDTDDSTLLDTKRLNMEMLDQKTKPKPVKRKRAGKEHTLSELSSSSRATRRARVAQQHNSDAVIHPGSVDELALVLVSTHPRVGSEYDEFIRQLFIIHNEVGCHSDVVSIVVERVRISRIRGRVKGASAVEECFCGLRLRESGSMVTMGSLRRWAKESPALVFKENENATGLGAVEGTWAVKLDQILRRVDTEEVSWMWLVQCVAYLTYQAELQMRAWTQQYYPNVSDDDFKTVWCFQARSEYYEKALKTYVLQKLAGSEKIGAPMGKRVQMASDSGKPKTVLPGPKAVASQSGNDDGRGAGAGYKRAGASNTSKHCTANQDSQFYTEEDTSSSHGAKPVCQEYANLNEDDMDCYNTGCESAMQECAPMAQDSEIVAHSQTGAPPVPDDASLVDEEVGTSSSLAELEPNRRWGPIALAVSLAAHKSPLPGPTTAAARPSPAAVVITTTPVTNTDCEEETVCQDGEPVVEDCEPMVQEFEQMIREFDFDNLNKDNLAKVTKPICEKHLNAKMFDLSKDYIIQSPYGSGKTHAAHEYIKENNLSFLSIVNLRSLKDGVVEKFADCNVLSYENKKKFYEEYTPGRSVVITLDSLMMLKEVDFEAKDYVVFLDEIHSLMVYLSSSTTLTDKRIQIWPLFARILKNCKQYIGVDNDICDATVEFLLKLIQRKHEYEFVINSHKSYGGVPATEMPTMEGMLTEMYRHLCDGENFTACFNERRQAEQVVQALKEMCEKDGMDPAKLKLFTSKEGARITDINQQWNDYCVFYSPIIVTGRDFNPDLPTTTFSFTRGTQTLSPEESVQQLARNRNMKRLYFHVENVVAVTPRFKTEEDIKACFKTERAALKGMCVYREVCDKRVSECGDACEMGENVFTKIVCTVAHRQHLMECGFRHHFIKILTNKGFQIYESDMTPLGLGKEETNILDQRILEEKERKIEEFIVKVRCGMPLASDDVFDTNALRHAEILHLPLEEQVFRDYKDEVFEDKPFQQHLNVIRLTQSTEESSNQFNAFIHGDFSFNSTQTDVVRVAIFCDIIGKCVPNCSSVLELQVSLGLKDEVPVPEGVLELWKVLNRDNTTKIPKNMKKLIQSLLNTGKSLFGYDYLDTRYTQPQKNGKKHNKTCYTVNPTWRDRQVALFRYSARYQEGKLDSKLARRYGLLRAHGESELEEQARVQKKIAEQERVQKRRSTYRSLGIIPDF